MTLCRPSDYYSIRGWAVARLGQLAFEQALKETRAVPDPGPIDDALARPDLFWSIDADGYDTLLSVDSLPNRPGIGRGDGPGVGDPRAEISLRSREGVRP